MSFNNSGSYENHLKDWQSKISSWADGKGWWDMPRDFGELCMLMVTEIAEMYEEYRDNHDYTETYYALPPKVIADYLRLLWFFTDTRVRNELDEEIPGAIEDLDFFFNREKEDNYREVQYIVERLKTHVGKRKPEGIPVELADLFIRQADTAEHLGIDLEAAVNEKMRYNEQRPYRHGGKRA